MLVLKSCVLPQNIEQSSIQLVALQIAISVMNPKNELCISTILNPPFNFLIYRSNHVIG